MKPPGNGHFLAWKLQISFLYPEFMIYKRAFDIQNYYQIVEKYITFAYQYETVKSEKLKWILTLQKQPSDGGKGEK